MKIFWIGILLALSLGRGAGFARDLKNQRHTVAAKEDLRRFVRATQKLPTLPAADQLWAKFGLSAPLRDPWGLPYRFEPKGAESFLWRSAGADGAYGTGDDLVEGAKFWGVREEGESDPNHPMSLDAF